MRVSLPYPPVSLWRTSPPVTNLGHKYMTVLNLVKWFKDMPLGGSSPYVPQSGVLITEREPFIHAHTNGAKKYGKWVGVVGGINITFMDGTDTTKPLYLITTMVTKGSKFKTPAQGTEPAGVGYIHAGRVKIMVGNSVATGLETTTEESTKALAVIANKAATVLAAHSDEAGYVDLVNGDYIWVTA